MKHLSEYRDAELVQGVLAEIRRIVTRPWVIMEICGGQTHAIMRNGLDQLLPPEIELVHGPGCPVCVTSLELIDKALAIAAQPGVIFTSYGDMLRVPGSRKDLFSVRASGGDVRVVYSPLDAVKIAQQNPDKQVVFFAIGFETTAPANAMSVLQAKALGLENYSVLVSHVCVPPAMHAILGSPSNRVQGFLAAGHVCAVMGYWEYTPIARQYHIPMVVTGFEPLDIAQGILMTVRQLEDGRVEVENGYPRVVSYEGNQPAQKVINQVFMTCDRKWRGIGLIPASGWCLRPEFSLFDAETRFGVGEIHPEESPLCISGQILQGLKKPHDCPAFGTLCSPEHPLGATMVSSEGACAAYYRYSRRTDEILSA
jgi:hydrogenase expression/formation protein HypD